MKEKTYAIVGASNNKEKYGNKVFLTLKAQGYSVVPINPKEEQIEGEKCYKSISDFNDKIDVVVFVVQPSVTETVLLEVKKLGIKDVWMQPGSESQKAKEFCDANGIRYVSNACIMVEGDKA